MYNQINTIAIFFLLFSILSQTSSNIIINEVPFAESGRKTLYNSNTILIQQTFPVTYTKSYSTIPSPTFFIDGFKNSDGITYQKLTTTFNGLTNAGFQLTMTPGSSTTILFLHLNYLTMQNIYNNYYVNNYDYAYSNLALSGTQTQSTTYNLPAFLQTAVASSNPANINIIVSMIGFEMSIIGNNKIDVLVTASVNSATQYTVKLQKTQAGTLALIQVQVSIIVADLFPDGVIFFSQSSTLLSTNPVYDYLSNINGDIYGFSFAYGLRGLKTNNSGALDYSWSDINSNVIEYSLGSNIEWVGTSFLAIYNQTNITTTVSDIPDTSTTQSSINTDNSSLIIGGSIGGGLLLILIGVIIKKLFFYRKKISQQEKLKYCHSTMLC